MNSIKYLRKLQGGIKMNISNDADKKETHIEKKSDSSAVLITFIKYSAYVVIFFGFLFFIVKFIVPLF